jgi:photosystem II stability/assembly factor-like uncharacterized protein
MTTVRLLKRLWLAVFSLALFSLFSPANSFSQPYSWIHGLDTISTECVSFNPLSKGRTLYCASLMDTGIFRSDDGGLSWRNYNDGLQPFGTSRLMQIFCLESDTNVLLAVSTSTGVYRSTNGGRKWSIVIEDGGILGEAITWHRETDALYYGQNYMGPVWKSLDHGATWIESAGSTEGITLCTIAVEPATRKRILAGSGDGGIALSDEEGKNWRSVFDPEDPNEVLRPEVPKIVWSEASPNVVLATRWLSKKNSIIRSLDAGETWSALAAMPRAWALEIDQRAATVGQQGPERFWIGLFNRGLEPNYVTSIIETRDAGASWFNTNMPNVEQVWMIKYDAASNKLVAATESGIYITTADILHELPRATVTPTFSNTTVDGFTHLTLSEGEYVRSIRLMDLSGRSVREYQSAEVDTRDLSSGLYIALVTTSKTNYRLKLSILK